jgi:hypothetical protein
VLVVFLRDVHLKASLKVDWSARCETPGGSAGQVRLLTAQSAEEAHRTPPGKRVPGAEINHLHTPLKLLKQLSFKTDSPESADDSMHQIPNSFLGHSHLNRYFQRNGLQVLQVRDNNH